MDLLAFKVVIEPDEDVWQSYYPAWEHLGAATFGDTPAEAAAAIKEVLEMLVGEIEEGEIEWPVPPGGPWRFSKPSIQDNPELMRLKCALEHADAVASHGGLPVVNPETGEEYDDIYRLIYINIDDVLAEIHARRTFLATRTGGLVSRIFPPPGSVNGASAAVTTSSYPHIDRTPVAGAPVVSGPVTGSPVAEPV